MRIMILFPPSADPTRPYITLPMQQAYLRAMGYQDVIVYDANLEAFDYLTEESYLRQARARVESALGGKGDSERAYLTSVLACADYVIDRIAEAKRTVRGAAPGSAAEILRAWMVFRRAVQLASAPFHPGGFRPGAYSSRYRWDDLLELSAAVSAHEENIFEDFFRVRVVPEVAASGAQLIKIVTTFSGQVIPAFTLAAMIKNACPGAHVNLGGICISYYARALAEWPLAGRYADSYSLFEHEYGYEHLTYLIAERLCTGQPSRIPNVLAPGETGAAVDPDHRVPQALERNVTPDFSGLALDRYFCSRLILPLAMSNGCHWHRCTFCLHPGDHRARSPESVVAAMSGLERLHGTRRFYFVDDSFSPEMLEGLADELLRTGSRFTWYCLARPEAAFDQALSRKLAEAGCGHVLLGLESASQRVLDRMDKGISIRAASQAIDNLCEAGIQAMVFAFTGFPGERREEAATTAAFLASIRGKVSGIVFQRFLLQGNTRVLDDAERMGAYIEQLPSTRAVYDIEWTMPGAVTRAEAEAAVHEFWQRFREEAPPWQAALHSIIEYTGPFLLLAGDLRSSDRFAVEPRRDVAGELAVHPSVSIRALNRGTWVLYHGESDRLMTVSTGMASLVGRFAAGASSAAVLEDAGPHRKDIEESLEKLRRLGILVSVEECAHAN